MLLSGILFNVFTIKDKLHNDITKAITFYELINEYIEKMTSLKGNEYSHSNFIKYRNSQKRINQFEGKQYKRTQIISMNWTMISLTDLLRFFELNMTTLTINRTITNITRVYKVP